MSENDEDLQKEVIEILGLTEASKADQDAAFAQVVSIADKRFALALPEMLSDEQLDHVESMRKHGKKTEEIMDWVQEQFPNYPEMIKAIIGDVADEAANNTAA